AQRDAQVVATRKALQVARALKRRATARRIAGCALLVEQKQSQPFAAVAAAARARVLVEPTRAIDVARDARALLAQVPEVGACDGLVAIACSLVELPRAERVARHGDAMLVVQSQVGARDERSGVTRALIQLRGSGLVAWAAHAVVEKHA